jgi:hypothetical protein
MEKLIKLSHEIGTLQAEIKMYFDPRYYGYNADKGTELQKELYKLLAEFTKLRTTIIDGE